MKQAVYASTRQRLGPARLSRELLLAWWAAWAWSMSRWRWTTCCHRLAVVYCIWEEYDAACPVRALSLSWAWEGYPTFGLLLLLVAMQAMLHVALLLLLLALLVRATATVAPPGVVTAVPAAVAAETAVPNATWVSAPWKDCALPAAAAMAATAASDVAGNLLLLLSMLLMLLLL